MISRSDLDRNGYAPTILQENTERCFLCGRSDRKLDRHEVFGASNRSKSKQDGLWVTLCHMPCHEGKDGAQYNPEIRLELQNLAQKAAMEAYGWTVEGFIYRYGKNYLIER